MYKSPHFTKVLLPSEMDFFHFKFSSPFKSNFLTTFISKLKLFNCSQLSESYSCRFPPRGEEQHQREVKRNSFKVLVFILSYLILLKGFHLILSYLAQWFSSYLAHWFSSYLFLSCSLAPVTSLQKSFVSRMRLVCAQMQPEPFSQEQKDTFLRMREART